MKKNLYFRNGYFDSFFVLGIPFIAAISVILVVVNPSLFWLVLTLDLSLLGYHHVIATYTRFRFTEQDSSQNKILLLYLPPLVLLSVFILFHMGGAIVITTIYLHWQWWHYTRQSEGISKAYKMKSNSESALSDFMDRTIFYIIPLFSFLLMNSRKPDKFLFADVYVLPIPEYLNLFLLLCMVGCLSYWFLYQTKALLKKKLSILLYFYYITHFLIYLFAYYFIEDITIGWLLINIWHNLQYICFVWVCNVNQFGVNKNSSFFRHWICRPRNWFFYFTVCYLATTFFYQGIDQLINFLALGSALPFTVIVYQTINFHHYIVDTFIWKLRKNKVKKSIGILG